MRYFIAFLFVLLIVFSVGFLYIYSLVRFDAYHIIDYNPKLTTQIYDKNDKLLANIFDEEHRLYASYEEIPQRIIEALLAIEDTTFFEHKGINPEAIFRAIIKDIKAMKLVEGASTLTQQLIKNIALTREKTFIRKLKEAVLAFKIEATLTKEEILERYLNHVYFGHGYYGIKTAALGYFHKNLDELSLKEISMLVGLPKAPSSYDPTRHFRLSISRANRVIARMNTLGWISDSQYNHAIKEEPKVYDDTLTLNQAPYIVDEIIKQASKSFKNVKSGGYIIKTSIDINLQNIAQEKLQDGYNEIAKRNKDHNQTTLNGAIIVVENATGNVLALVGGVDYEKSNFNRATQSNRQPGSSFKPFVYQIALNLGYSPMSRVPDISRVYTNQPNNKDWKPKNYGGTFDGLISLKQALAKSRNLATINLLNELGLDTVHYELLKMGFKNIPKDLSIALGSFGISPWDFAKFYSIFANNGKMNEPHIITSVSNRYNKELSLDFKQKSISTPEQNYLMVDILKTAVFNGTGANAITPGVEIAGKTGTTNDNVDAWFCGFIPEIEVLVWFGNDDNKPMKRTETGSKAAAPVFREFVKAYLEYNPKTQRKFEIPKGVHTGIYDGKEAFFTESSPLPKKSNLSITEDTGLLF